MTDTPFLAGNDLHAPLRLLTTFYANTRHSRMRLTEHNRFTSPVNSCTLLLLYIISDSLRVTLQSIFLFNPPFFNPTYEGQSAQFTLPI